MQNTKTNPTENSETNLLAVARPVPNIASLLNGDAQYLESRAQKGRDAFVDRSAPLWYFERDLIGVPFVVVTPPQFGTLKDSQFGPREVARIGVSILDLTVPGGRALAPQIAQLSHRYLLNDLRGLTENELVGGHVWTLGRNPSYPMTPRGQYPVTLKIYEYGVDMPEVVDAENPPADGFTPQNPPSVESAPRADTRPSATWQAVERANQTPASLPTSDQMDAARARYGLSAGLGAAQAQVRPAWFQGVPQSESEVKRPRGRPRTHTDN